MGFRVLGRDKVVFFKNLLAALADLNWALSRPRKHRKKLLPYETEMFSRDILLPASNDFALQDIE